MHPPILSRCRNEMYLIFSKKGNISKQQCQKRWPTSFLTCYTGECFENLRVYIHIRQIWKRSRWSYFPPDGFKFQNIAVMVSAHVESIIFLNPLGRHGNERPVEAEYTLPPSKGAGKDMRPHAVALELTVVKQSCPLKTNFQRVPQFIWSGKQKRFEKYWKGFAWMLWGWPSLFSERSKLRQENIVVMNASNLAIATIIPSNKPELDEEKPEKTDNTLT